MSKATREAKVKLLAEFVNRSGVNCVAIGVLAPFAGIVFPRSELQIEFSNLAIGGLAFLVAGVSLHLIARRILDGLEDDAK